MPTEKYKDYRLYYIAELKFSEGKPYLLDISKWDKYFPDMKPVNFNLNFKPIKDVPLWGKIFVSFSFGFLFLVIMLILLIKYGKTP